MYTYIYIYISNAYAYDVHMFIYTIYTIIHIYLNWAVDFWVAKSFVQEMICTKVKAKVKTHTAIKCNYWSQNVAPIEQQWNMKIN